MASTIVFTDTIGTAILSNGAPSPGDRFSNWVLMPNPVGSSAFRVSDGALTFISLRDDYGASFELRDIPIVAVGGVRMVEIAARLQMHLLKGGQCAINTGDVVSSSYATCGIMPGTRPSLTQTNAGLLRYTLSLSLINLAVSPVAMICRYA